jgi:hypothetical protein
MPPSSTEPVDLLDLKLLPAWVKEPPQPKQYEHHKGEENRERSRDGRGPEQRFRKPRAPRTFDKKREGDQSSRPRRPQDRHRPAGPRKDRSSLDRSAPQPPKPLDVEVRFLPHTPALDHVIAQIKLGAVAYSVFSLARLFLEKPERYDVRLKAKAESPLHQLGENGSLSADREFLERNAFQFAQKDFYKIDITESEPIKGNFTNVARCKLSGTLLGPTNHHSYQARLRNLYEQRFGRRMSFGDYQRQIEIVSDPAAVEQWKEAARKITTFVTLNDDPPASFASAGEAERDFRQKHLPALLRKVEETTIDGVSSRRLSDRAIHRAIEDAWTRETRSPSQMMQELSMHLREAGLNIFRHRKGMLFVSPIRVRPFGHEGAVLSPTVSAILETLRASPRINRKDLAEKIVVDPAGEGAESRKLALASDLHWLVSEGYVIEFNDGSLDLPRAKKPKPEGKAEDVAVATVETAPVIETNVEAVGASEPRPAE